MKLKKNLKFLLFILSSIVILIALFAINNSLVKNKPSIRFQKPEYQHTGKCIDCERQFSADTRWMAQSNKCYDCESDLIARSGGDFSAAYGGVKTKCFDC